MSRPRIPSRSAVLGACVIACASAACIGPSRGQETTAADKQPEAMSSEEVAAIEEAEDADRERWPAIPEFVDDDEWIRTTSGEWLKGEFIALNRERVEFDSDELESVKLDWEDVAEVITSRYFAVVQADRTVVVGAVRVLDDSVYIRTTEGVVRLPRASVMRVIRAVEGHANWSGHVRVSGTRRAGNTDQTDFSVSADVTRRTTNARTELSLDQVLSEIDGASTTDNQTLRGNHDLYVSPRLYVTPLGFELFRDPFQNIDLRATPYAGLGYTLVDSPDHEWDVSAGLGYRFLRFESVEPGEEDTRETGTALLGTKYDYEITKNIDLALGYEIQIGLEDIDDTNQDASLELSFDFVWDLEFDVRFVWKHVGQPEADDNGDTPDPDDFRIDIGLTWEF